MENEKPFQITEGPYRGLDGHHLLKIVEAKIDELLDNRPDSSDREELDAKLAAVRKTIEIEKNIKIGSSNFCAIAIAMETSYDFGTEDWKHWLKLAFILLPICLKQEIDECDDLQSKYEFLFNEIFYNSEEPFDSDFSIFHDNNLIETISVEGFYVSVASLYKLNDFYFVAHEAGSSGPFLDETVARKTNGLED
jgi:hypothetical protein